MKKSQEFELRKYCGDLSALSGIKDYVYNDGPARGVRALDLKSGTGVEMTVLADRGLDIPYLSYKGVNMGLLSKVGLRSGALYSENVAVSIPAKTLDSALLAIHAGQARGLGILLTAILPAAALLCGVTIIIRRRRTL